MPTARSYGPRDRAGRGRARPADQDLDRTLRRGALGRGALVWPVVRTLVLLGAAALALAGCTGGDGAPGAAGGPPASTASPPPGGGGMTAPTPAPTRTPTRPPTSARPAPPPVTTDAPCPYADRQLMAETVGQRIGRTTVTRTRPYVGCGYYRADGEKAVDIAVSVRGSAGAAQAAAVALGGAAANPVDGVADGGVVAVTDAGTVLAVSEGATLVVVRVNQRVPLEAAEIAKLVVAKV